MPPPEFRSSDLRQNLSTPFWRKEDSSSHSFGPICWAWAGFFFFLRGLRHTLLLVRAEEDGEERTHILGPAPRNPAPELGRTFAALGMFFFGSLFLRVCKNEEIVCYHTESRDGENSARNRTAGFSPCFHLPRRLPFWVLGAYF